MKSLLTEKAFAKQEPFEINVAAIYDDKGSDFSPSYYNPKVIGEDFTKEFKEEFRELISKFGELCVTSDVKLGGRRQNSRSKIWEFESKFVNSKKYTDKFNEKDHFFNDVKRAFEDIIYFFTMDKEFKGEEESKKRKRSKKLQRVFDDIDKCGAGVYNAVCEVRDGLIFEKQKSLASQLIAIRQDLVEQVVRDLIVQRKLPKFRTGLYVHVKIHFKNLVPEKWNIQEGEVPDSEAWRLYEEVKISKEHNRLFLKELESRYEFNYIIDNLVNKIHGMLDDALVKDEHGKQQSWDVLKESIDPSLKQVGLKFQNVIKYGDKGDVYGINEKTTPVFAIILHLFEDGVFNQEGITNYKKITSLLDALNKYVIGETSVFPRNFNDVVRKLASSKNENSANDKKLAARIVEELIEYALRNEEGKIAESLLFDKNTKEVSDIAIQVIENLASRGEEFLIDGVVKLLLNNRKSNKIDGVVKLLLNNRKSNKNVVDKIIDKFAESDNYENRKVLAGYVVSLTEKEEAVLGYILNRPKITENFKGFLIEMFLARGKEPRKGRVNLNRIHKEGLFYEQDLEYDILISKEYKYSLKLPIFKKTTIIFKVKARYDSSGELVRDGWGYKIFYPYDEYRKDFPGMCWSSSLIRYIDSYNDVNVKKIVKILNKSERSSKDMSNLKDKIKKEDLLKLLPKDALKSTVCDQVFKSVVLLPVEMWGDWFKFSDGIKAIKESIRSVKDLKDFLSRMHDDFKVDFCNAIFKKDDYHVNSFIKTIIKNAGDVKEFMSVLGESIVYKKIFCKNDGLMLYFYELYGGEEYSVEKKRPDVGILQYYMEAFSDRIKGESAIKSILKTTGVDVDKLEPGQLSRMIDFREYVSAISSRKLSVKHKAKLLAYFLALWKPEKIDTDIFNKLYPLILSLKSHEIKFSNGDKFYKLLKCSSGSYQTDKEDSIKKSVLLTKLMHADSKSKINIDKAGFGKILSFINKTTKSKGELVSLLIDLVKVADEKVIKHHFKGILEFDFGDKDVFSYKVKDFLEVFSAKKSLEDIEWRYFSKICDRLFMEGSKQRYSYLVVSEFFKEGGKKNILNSLFARMEKNKIHNKHFFNNIFSLIGSLEDEENKVKFYKKFLHEIDLAWAEKVDFASKMYEIYLGFKKIENEMDFLNVLADDERLKNVNKNFNSKLLEQENYYNQIDKRIGGVMKKAGVALRVVRLHEEQKVKLGSEDTVVQYIRKLNLAFNDALKEYVKEYINEPAEKRRDGIKKIGVEIKRHLLSLGFKNAQIDSVLKDEAISLAAKAAISSEEEKIREKAPSIPKRPASKKSDADKQKPSVPFLRNRRIEVDLEKDLFEQLEFIQNLSKKDGGCIKSFSYKACKLWHGRVGSCPWLFISPKKEVDTGSENKNKVLALIDWNKLKEDEDLEKKMKIMYLIAKHVNKAYEGKIAVNAKVSLQAIDADLEEKYVKALGNMQGKHISFLLYLNDELSAVQQEKVARWFLEFRQDLEDNGVPLADAPLSNEMLWSKGFFILRDRREYNKDMKFYQGIKDHIYRDDAGRFNRELFEIQKKVWGNEAGFDRNEVKKKIDDYTNELLIRGKYTGGIERDKCDLDIVDKMLLEDWKPNKKINSKFFSIVKKTFNENRKLRGEGKKEKIPSGVH